MVGRVSRKRHAPLALNVVPLQLQNTAARMESTGVGGKIQMSETTAQLILDAGKVSWIKARQETVHAKGKSELCGAVFWEAHGFL